MNLRRLLGSGWLPHVFVAGGPRPPHHLRVPVFAAEPSRTAPDPAHATTDTPLFAHAPAAGTTPVFAGDLPLSASGGMPLFARDPVAGDAPISAGDPDPADTPLFARDPAVPAPADRSGLAA